MEKNIRIKVSYDGSNYFGWQKQPDKKTIQGELEFCIRKVFGIKKAEVIGSGRTDAGVHALSQVASFKIETSIPTEKIPEILNNNLPKDISVTEAIEVGENFHPRFSAHRKTYRYRIFPSRVRSPFLKDHSYMVKYRLDVDKMKSEIKSLEGEHDFCGFMSSGSSVVSTVRMIYKADIYEDGEELVIEVCGNGFLYNMVRIIAGTMVDIGRGAIDLPLSDIISSKDRSKAGHTAPAQGLFLVDVEY